MTDEAGLDYETWSDVELGGDQARGLPNYVASPNFGVLCASVSAGNNGQQSEWTFDWVFNRVWYWGTDGTRAWKECVGSATQELARFFALTTEPIMAHNAPFERAVTHWLFPDFDPFRFQDSAVDARILGAESKLEVASRQLTDTAKREVGAELIQLFCVPREEYDYKMPTAELIEANGHMDLWLEFIDYCEVDAKGGREIRKTARRILADFDPDLIDREALYEQATWEMNQAGWAVDIPLVEKMKQRAWANSIIAKRSFEVEDEGMTEKFFGSHVQMKKFLAARGVKVKSLDKYHLPLHLTRVKQRIAKLNKELQDGDYPNLKRELGRLEEAEAMLETKMEIGGSTLTKLPVILRLVSEDGILRDQYMHFGAGQTGRTTGRGVQMQNIKKLDGVIRDVETLYDFKTHWSNGDMAGQLRQVFRSRHPEGEILVGDFSGVESRGMAYSAEEEWKLQTFREGKDLYCVLVTRFIPGLEYDEVSDKDGKLYYELRPRGKYSELSCQYQASGKAVQDFMFRLGFSVTIEDATQNVMDWRRACPAIVDYWFLLGQLLSDCVMSNMVVEAQIGYGMRARVSPFALPSVQEVHPGAISLCVQIILPDGTPFVTRFIHGAYMNGKQICYYKPSERLSQGVLWQGINQTLSKKKSAELGYDVEVPYHIYGGKLSAIFTQSLCREIFFESLHRLRTLFIEYNVKNAVICGQFHDEINVDWWPEEGGTSKKDVEHLMRYAMSETRLKGFPLEVDLKSAYRYIK